MIRGNMYKLMLIIFMLFSVSLLACSGGGGGGGGGSSNTPAPQPSIQTEPSSFDFGPVTPGNSALPLYVAIKNNGSNNVDISNISLTDATNFNMNLNGGSDPCSSTSLTLTPGDSCTAEITFQPQSTDSFSTNLTITSNDPVNSTHNMPLSGSQESVSALNVSISQAEVDCVSGIATVYVTVTDQGGYPVITLTKDDFAVTEVGGYAGLPISTPFVENNATLSTALVMDYSGSIITYPDMVSDMEESVVNYINQLGAEDEAAIVKFASEPEEVQPFTSDKNLLITAVNADWGIGRGTAMYDAGVMAVDNTKTRTKDRKAVILISDGVDTHSTGSDVDGLITYAKSNNVPFFPIGLGEEINIAELQRIADETGGTYYEAANSDNLQGVYQQLADVLFKYQYILTYNSGLAGGTTADLTIEATLSAATPGSGTRSVTRCP